jgi:hypothetical protein
MHAISLISASLSESERAELPCEPVAGVCAVTGLAGPCVPRKHLLGKSFTNLDVLAAPSSGMVGVETYQALGYKWERMSSWICDGLTFRRLTRVEVRPLVLEGVAAERWAGYITTSYKKHGALWAKVNGPGRAVWRFEMRDVDCSDRARMAEVWSRLNEELRGGIGRSVLESLDCPPFLIGKVGVARWLAFEAWARPIWRSGLYQLMCYLLPSNEELAGERVEQAT